jgi:hypothetical protein
MLTHTLPLNDRVSRPLHLTDDEAMELFERGFRFSIFRPGREACQLSYPIETVIDHVHGTLTIRQPDGRG